MMCGCRDAFLAFFKMAFGYARLQKRPAVRDVDTSLLDDWMCKPGETIWTANAEGFDRDSVWSRNCQKVAIEVTDASTPWPVGCELTMPSSEPRPGSYIIRCDGPIGGRVHSGIGIQFGSFAVSFPVWFLSWWWLEFCDFVDSTSRPLQSTW